MLSYHRFQIQLVAIAIGLICWAVPALADPPARVGRLMMIEGPVKFYADQEEGWQAARLNLPVTSENSLWTERSGRAEWRAGPMAVRLDHDTVLDVQTLDDSNAVLYVQRGAVNIRIGLLEKNETWKVFTPEGQITLRARGSYRIETDPDKGESRFAVLAGRARIESRSGAPWIDAGRMALLSREALRMEPLARTDFDDWAQARDEGLDPERVTHVSPYMTGHEDLDRYGTWEPAEEYGRVWYPSRVDDDWAPYRYGSWRYVRPWGWTWIDDSPWGFAPFHYGRWVQVRGRWAWWPGNRIYRPVYSPALVAWVGGDGWNVSIGSGRGPGIGWFPLAPWEAYVPWYTHSPGYVYNINHIHVGRPVQVRPPRDYRNFKPGVTVVPPSTFENRHPVWRDRIRNPGESLWTQKPVQEVNALPPRPAHVRPPQSKPAMLPPGSGISTSPGGATQAPVATPMPLQQREVSPRGPKPVSPTPEPRGPAGSNPPAGAKPGLAVQPDTSPDSMPSRPSPSRQSGSPASQAPTTSSMPSQHGQPASPATSTQPAPVYTAPRARTTGESAPTDGRAARSERGERSERPRPEPSATRPAGSERAPVAERTTVDRGVPRDKPVERREERPREIKPEKERTSEKVERDNRDKSDRSEKGERTQQR